MAHVRMLRDRFFTPKDDRRVSIQYLKDHEYSVRQAWADELVAAGDAEAIATPASAQEGGAAAATGKAGKAG